MPLRTTAWLCALLAIGAIHGAYLISASNGVVPWCLPYVDGCTSISRAARHGAANTLFRALLLPGAALLCLFWWQAGARLQAGWPQRWVRLTGWGGALFFALYVTMLGVEGELFQWLRRYGINLMFGLTVLAQMLLAATVIRHTHGAPRRMLTGYCALMLVLGLASLPLQALGGEAADEPLDALEWVLAMVVFLYFPLAEAALSRAARAGDRL